MSTRQVLLSLVVTGILQAAVASDQIYPLPGTPPELEDRVGIRWPLFRGIAYRAEVMVDGKPMGFMIHDESSGHAYIHWLTSEEFAFWGCGRTFTDSYDCDRVWRVVNTNRHTVLPMILVGFDTQKALPMFRKSRVAYSGRLPNGNFGCFVYDWRSAEYVLKWDTGAAYATSGANYPDRAEFSDNGEEVICRQVLGWHPGMGESPDTPNIPIYGKEFRRRLPARR